MKTRPQARPNLALRQQRKKRHWTQTELARMLGTTYLSVCRWESGATVPSLYYCKRLCELFALSAEELGLIASPDRVPEVTPAAPLPDKQTGIWRVPHHRNPFFTGRTRILDQLYTLLHTNQTGTAGCALSGLGGMGKTQIAIEYAFRQRDSYQTILWFNAETREVFSAEVANLARQLKLLGPEEQDSHYAHVAVSRWLESQENCLLILDNVEDVALIETLLPANFRGHILLTTRRQAPGLLVQRLDIDELSVEEGALFLLQRARFLALGMGSDAVVETTFQQAKTICTLLGGLPLALDQAGAYIEETGCSLLDYLEHFQVSRSRLLLRRGQSGGTHPEAISTTVALCLEKIASEQPAALELLRCCVWLTPDAIPEELFTRGAPDLGPLLAPLANDALAFDLLFVTLRAYSLIQRHPGEKMFSMHRLVQTILRDSLDEAEQAQWAQRCVSAIKRVFPGAALSFWEESMRLLPQAQVCVSLISRWQMMFLEAAQLLDLTGYYVMQQGHYQEAEALLQQGEQMFEKLAYMASPDFAACLEHLGELYWHTNRLELSRSIRQRALDIAENCSGFSHPQIAVILDGLALTCRTQGYPDQARPLLERAATIYEQIECQGALSPVLEQDRIGCLENLGILLIEQGQFEHAEIFLARGYALSKSLWGEQHPLVAFASHNLAYLYEWRGQYEQARGLYLRALSIREQNLNAWHPDIAATLHNLARVYQRQVQYTEAETLFQRALLIREQVLGARHASVAHTLSQMGSLYLEQKMFERALALFTQALAIREDALGSDHPEVAWDLEALAETYETLGRDLEAEHLIQRALSIYESRLGKDHLDSIESLLIAGNLAEKRQNARQAEDFFQRALAICERVLGREHPKTARSLQRLARFVAGQKRVIETLSFSE